jgi:hypothetical protein
MPTVNLCVDLVRGQPPRAVPVADGTGRRATAANRLRASNPLCTRPGPPLSTSRPVEPRDAYARAPGAMVSQDVTTQVRTERRVRPRV